MTKVLDAHALMVYLEKEAGYEKVRDLFALATESGRSLLLTTVNWGEIYYAILREKGEEEAETISALLDTFPIEVVDVDKKIAKQAGIFKASKKMSYADCFAAALAKIKKAELVTGDRELKQIESEVKIQWL